MYDLAVTTFYVDSDLGDDGDTGGTGDPFQSISFAFTQMGASDTMVIRYASGTAYVETSQITTSVSAPQLIGEDSTGTLATSFDFNLDERPRVEFNHSAIGISHTNSSTFLMCGIIFDGLGTASSCYSGGGLHNSIPTAEDCQFLNCTAGSVLVTDGGSEWTRCQFTGGAFGVNLLGNVNIFEACVFDEIDGLAIEKFGSGITATLRNCLFFHCCVTSPGVLSPLDFSTSSGGWTVQNCLFVDNYCQHGLPGSTYENNNCYRSDGGAVFHDAGNWNGATDSDDFSENPEFIDEDAGDWRLAEGNILADLGVSNAVTNAFNRVPFADPPPIGPLFIGITLSVRIDQVEPLGTSASVFTISGFVIAEDTVLTLTLSVNGSVQALPITPDLTFSEVVALITGLNTLIVTATDSDESDEKTIIVASQPDEAREPVLLSAIGDVIERVPWHLRSMRA